MNEQTQKMLQQLADKLGVTAQYLWATLVRGNRVEGIILFGFIAVGIAFGVVSYKMFRAGFKTKEDDEDAYWFAGWITGGIGAAFVFGCAYWAIMDTFCPEYGALSEILSHLK